MEAVRTTVVSLRRMLISASGACGMKHVMPPAESKSESLVFSGAYFSDTHQQVRG